MHSLHHKKGGSTLLELLIILVIVGMLVQQAIPHYGVFIEKSRAKERLAELLSLQTQIEICFFETHDYEKCVGELRIDSSNILETEATTFTYRLTLHSAKESVACYAYETNHEHRLMAVSVEGEEEPAC